MAREQFPHDIKSIVGSRSEKIFILSKLEPNLSVQNEKLF